jgi:hypothetical protein
VNYEDGLEYSNEITSLLFHYCMRIEPTGTLRRKERDIKSVEMIASPQIVEEDSYWNDQASDLMGEPGGSNRLEAGLRLLQGKGVLGPVQRSEGIATPLAGFHGSGYSLQYKNATIIIHAVASPSAWGVESLLCTGDEDFVAFLVRRAAQKGFALTRGHLDRGGKTIDTPEEADVLRLLGVDWVEPENRNHSFLSQKSML